MYLVDRVGSPKLIFFDCDSTLSAIEGIDELARLRGAEVLAQVAALTNDAMDGRVPVEAIFRRRLEIIRPTRADVAAVGQLYVENVEPTARATVEALRATGWTPIIVSGGFNPIIAPLAEFLGIARVEAVDLYFDAIGTYAGFDENSPMTRSGGKPRCVEAIKRELGAGRTALVGDGVSDLEAREVVDDFFGFGGFVERPKVKANAHTFVRRLDEILLLLNQ